MAAVWHLVLDRAPVEEILDLLLRNGIRALPPLALARVEDGGVRVVVRGGIRVVAHTATGPQTLDGVAPSTWSEHLIADVSAVDVGDTADLDASPFRVATGIVLLSGLALPCDASVGLSMGDLSSFDDADSFDEPSRTDWASADPRRPAAPPAAVPSAPAVSPEPAVSPDPAVASSDPAVGAPESSVAAPESVLKTSDAVETASDAVETASDAVETASDAVETASDAVETASDAVETASDAGATHESVPTSESVVASDEPVVSTPEGEEVAPEPVAAAPDEAAVAAEPPVWFAGEDREGDDATSEEPVTPEPEPVPARPKGIAAAFRNRNSARTRQRDSSEDSSAEPVLGEPVLGEPGGVEADRREQDDQRAVPAALASEPVAPPVAEPLSAAPVETLPWLAELVDAPPPSEVTEPVAPDPDDVPRSPSGVAAPLDPPPPLLPPPGYNLGTSAVVDLRTDPVPAGRPPARWNTGSMRVVVDRFRSAPPPPEQPAEATPSESVSDARDDAPRSVPSWRSSGTGIVDTRFGAITPYVEAPSSPWSDAGSAPVESSFDDILAGDDGRDHPPTADLSAEAGPDTDAPAGPPSTPDEAGATDQVENASTGQDELDTGAGQEPGAADEAFAARESQESVAGDERSDAAVAPTDDAGPETETRAAEEEPAAGVRTADESGPSDDDPNADVDEAEVRDESAESSGDADVDADPVQAADGARDEGTDREVRLEEARDADGPEPADDDEAAGDANPADQSPADETHSGGARPAGETRWSAYARPDDAAAPSEEARLAEEERRAEEARLADEARFADDPPASAYAAAATEEDAGLVPAFRPASGSRPGWAPGDLALPAPTGVRPGQLLPPRLVPPLSPPPRTDGSSETQHMPRTGPAAPVRPPSLLRPSSPARPSSDALPPPPGAGSEGGRLMPPTPGRGTAARNGYPSTPPRVPDVVDDRFVDDRFVDDDGDGHGDDDRSPLVAGVLCVAGHPNPPGAPACRRCGQPVPPQAPMSMPRPALGVLRFITGERIRLDGPLILGRDPRPVNTGGGPAEMVTVKSPTGQVSRTHAEVRLIGWDVALIDLGATNGTRVTAPGSAPAVLEPGVPTMIVPGTHVELGGEVQFVFSVEP